MVDYKDSTSAKGQRKRPRLQNYISTKYSALSEQDAASKSISQQTLIFS